MIISRYVLLKCAFNIALVLFSFVVLFAVFTILISLSDIGKGHFTIYSMLIYIIALLPNFLYLLMPLSVLVGVMIGMLSLVNYSEYAIIRTSGVSLKLIAKLLLILGLGFSIITFILGEVIAPNANQFAKTYRLKKLSQLVTTNLRSGIWSKDGNNTFINIKQVMPDNSIVDVNVFEYTESFVLKKYIYAASGNYNQLQHNWILNNVFIREYLSNKIMINKFKNFSWTTSIDPSYFNILIIDPQDMSLLGLLKYMKLLKNNNQAVNRYEVAFWNKLIYPFACISMAIVAIGFIPNNRRNINLGAKMFIGILVGIAFFFISKLTGYMAVIFAWNPIISSILPTLILFLSGFYFILGKKNN